MKCANCGRQVNENFSYCNGCGAKLSKDGEQTVNHVAASLSSSLGYIGGFGLAFLVGLVAIMLNKNIAPQVLIIIAAAYLTTLFGICFMIIKQISNLSATKTGQNSDTPEDHQTSKLKMPDAAPQLDEAHQPFISITEHTTRTLDKVPANEN